MAEYISKQQKERIKGLQLKLDDLWGEVERLTDQLSALEMCMENFKTKPNFPSGKDIEDMQSSIRRLRNVCKPNRE
ncbi:hypothetical protein TcWFU_006361 [Taenia crassiceps]|uniref:Uncharacterized protein n=1 Tax=Taenia crassiceps TaxID=6207 RepID=A0ABR4QA17_9CEST